MFFLNKRLLNVIVSFRDVSILCFLVFMLGWLVLDIRLKVELSLKGGRLRGKIVLKSDNVNLVGERVVGR